MYRVITPTKVKSKPTGLLPIITSILKNDSVQCYLTIIALGLLLGFAIVKRLDSFM